MPRDDAMEVDPAGFPHVAPMEEDPAGFPHVAPMEVDPAGFPHIAPMEVEKHPRYYELDQLTTPELRSLCNARGMTCRKQPKVHHVGDPRPPYLPRKRLIKKIL